MRKLYYFIFAISILFNIELKAEKIYGWGENYEGQIGDGTTTNRKSPVLIGNEHNWKEVSCGGYFSIGIKSDGTIWKWGSLVNNNESIIPVLMDKKADWMQVSCGYSHSIALKSDGTMWSWGFNSYGQLGIGKTSYSESITKIGNDTNWLKIFCGDYHSLAIKSDGTLWAWGSSFNTSPVQISSETNWIEASGGQSHTLALKSDGTLWAWGRNEYGQLGDGTITSRKSPVQIGSESNWLHVSCGNSHTIAIKSDGTLWAWGRNNYSQLGDGTTTDRHSPVQIGSESNWSQVVGGNNRSVAIKTDASLWSWGLNSITDRLGNGTSMDKKSPFQIGRQIKWLSVSSGWGHSIGIAIPTTATLSTSSITNIYSNSVSSGGTISDDGGYPVTARGICWSKSPNPTISDSKTTNGKGNGSFNSYITEIDTNIKYFVRAYATNEIGTAYGNQISFTIPLTSPTVLTLDITEITSYSAIVGGNLTHDGGYSETVRGICWSKSPNPTIKNSRISGGKGEGSFIGFITGLDSYTKYYVRAYAINTKDTTYGNQDSLTTLLNSDVYAYRLLGWGNNEKGQLGNKSKTNSRSPVQIGIESNWTQVSGGEYHTIAIKSDGTLWAWGSNDNGQLGLGDLIDRLSPVRIGNESNWKQVSCGNYHNIALKSDGTLWAWGSNDNGQLGTGDLKYHTSPIQILSESKWVKISCGKYHSHAIKSDGTLWGWGNNAYGQLGDGTITDDRKIPNQIGSESNWSKISCGHFHNLAIKSDGTLWAWGYNDSGQLGNKSDNNSTIPVQIGSESNWSQVSCGGNHTIALKSDSTLWAWGENYYGQVGYGYDYDWSYPIKIGGESKWLQISCGNNHSLAIKNDSTLWAWGSNRDGQIGEGTFNSITDIPFQIGSDSNWMKVSCGYFHSFALIEPSQATISTLDVTNIKSDSASSGGIISDDGGLSITARGVCWSTSPNPTIENNKTVDGIGKVNFTSIITGLDSNTYYYIRAYATNKLGTVYGNQVSFAISSTIPTVKTLNLTDISSYSAKSGGIITTDGGDTITARGVCWSTIRNPTIENPKTSDGTGIGNFTSDIYDLDSYTKYYVRAYATNSNGTAYGNEDSITTLFNNDLKSHRIFGWGRNNSGQLGNITKFNIPNLINKESNWSHVACGEEHIISIKSDGTLWAWGNNQNGRLGDGTEKDSRIPVKIGNESNWSIASCGKLHTLAIKSDGTLWAWGNNQFGQLGTGDTLDRSSPVQIGSDRNWSQITCGYHHSIAIKSDGTLWAWGWNDEGQLGIGDNSNRSIPVQIGTESNWLKVSSGEKHNIALKSNNTLWAWGLNIYGQLGDGTKSNRKSPVQIGSDSNWSQVSCGASHSQAIKSDGTLWAWGSNYSKQLGLGDNGPSYKIIPVQIGSDKNWTQVSCGDLHNMAIKSDSTLWAWGDNQSGQLGDGTNTWKKSPVQIRSDRKWLKVICGINFSIAFTTLTTPTLSTLKVTDITSNTASSGGFITDDGGASVTTRGVCWSTTENPTIENSKSIDGFGAGNFTSAITGSDLNETYYVRAYATNELGTAYGKQISFTKNLPTVITRKITGIKLNNAKSGGEIPSDGGNPIIARGVCWSITQNPTIENNKTSNGYGAGEFNSSISGLDSNTKYFVRAYATNEAGTAYGNELSFVIESPQTIPAVTTTEIKIISSNSVQCGGNIISDGWKSITARGVCWATYSHPHIGGNKTSDGTGSGNFTSEITGLKLNTTYFVRDYATNSLGTSYGEQISFILDSIETNVTDSRAEIFNFKASPNPFFDDVNIEFNLPSNNKVSLQVYDLSGYEISTIFEGSLEAGIHKYTLESTNLSASLYIVVLTIGNERIAREVIRVK